MKNNDRWLRVSKLLGGVFLVMLVGFLGLDFWREGIFNQDLGLNVLVVGERSVGVMSLRPKENTIQWLRFPSDLKVRVYNSSASYPIASLWKYSRSEHNPYVVVEKSIGSMLGIVIARTIKVGGEASVEQALNSFWSLGTSTDLSLRDRLVMRGLISESILSKKVIELELPQTAFSVVVEPDGKEFLVINEVALVWLKDKFYFESIMSEDVEVVVNNVSGVVGMGNQTARQMESAGMKVLEVKNDESDGVSTPGCWYSVAKKPNFSMAIEWLEKQMGCRVLSDTENKKVEDGVIKLWLK